MKVIWNKASEKYAANTGYLRLHGMLLTQKRSQDSDLLGNQYQDACYKTKYDLSPTQISLCPTLQKPKEKILTESVQTNL